MYEVYCIFIYSNKNVGPLLVAGHPLWSEEIKEFNLKGSQVWDVSWEDHDGSWSADPPSIWRFKKNSSENLIFKFNPCRFTKFVKSNEKVKDYPDVIYLTMATMVISELWP